MTPFFIDFHCHPSMKPYGKSFNGNPVGNNSVNPREESSAWHYDAPNLFDRGIQMLAGISRFTQSDFSTLAFGDVRLVCASLYPIEKGFFNNRLGTGTVSDVVDDFITGVGRARVNYIQGIGNYYEDLVREYHYYESLHNVPITTFSGTYKYMLVRNFTEVQNILLEDPMKDSIVFVILSIEGLHVLNENIDGTIDEQRVLANVRNIKKWPFAPFFVTFSHHFNNHLCGHARSLTGVVGKAANQEEGLNLGLTPLGRKVLDEVLAKNNGKRILIDIKHMSAQGRREYLKILSTDYAGQDIPVIISHGAANGLKSMDDKTISSPTTSHKLLQEDINFYDDEIVAVAKSKGIMALQLDERRIASSSTLKSVKHSVFMNKIRHYRAELLWNQLQHIAELLDRNDLPAWECMAIGSDFDGIINPLNGFLTAETMTHLEGYLERYVYNYIRDHGKDLKPYNCLKPDEIVNRIFHSNGLDFIKRHY